MTLRPLALPLLLCAGLAGCSDDDYGSERPVQDMTVVVTESDMAVSVPDMMATAPDMADVPDAAAAPDGAAVITDL